MQDKNQTVLNMDKPRFINSHPQGKTLCIDTTVFLTEEKGLGVGVLTLVLSRCSMKTSTETLFSGKHKTQVTSQAHLFTIQDLQ